MEPVFEIWSPHFVGDDLLVLDVTPANLPEIDQPDEEWINGCLAGAGIQARAVRWRVRRSWCNYYSHFPAGEDWKDRWRITWTLEVAVEARERPPSRLSTAPAWFDRLDRSWKMADDDEDGDTGTLLFAVPPGAAVAGQAEQVARELRALGAADVELSTHAYDDGWTEARIRFTCARFGERVEALDAIVWRLNAAGFVTNWSRLLHAQTRR